MPPTTEITLRAMRFHALVGILPHEYSNAQPIEVDLVVTVTGEHRAKGGGESVVDYRRLYDAAASVIASGHIDFLEVIAERIASGALAASERITRARVAVRKPHVALGGPLAFAEVRIDRHRPAAGG
jgi:dihydroneopterin aldolase